MKPSDTQPPAEPERHPVGTGPAPWARARRRHAWARSSAGPWARWWAARWRQWPGDWAAGSSPRPSTRATRSATGASTTAAAPTQSRTRASRSLEPAYRYGWESRAANPRALWEELEERLKEGWRCKRCERDWEDARDPARDAFERLEGALFHDPEAPRSAGSLSAAPGRARAQPRPTARAGGPRCPAPRAARAHPAAGAARGQHEPSSAQLLAQPPQLAPRPAHTRRGRPRASPRARPAPPTTAPAPARAPLRGLQPQRARPPREQRPAQPRPGELLHVRVPREHLQHLVPRTSSAPRRASGPPAAGAGARARRALARCPRAPGAPEATKAAAASEAAQRIQALEVLEPPGRPGLPARAGGAGAGRPQAASTRGQRALLVEERRAPRPPAPRPRAPESTRAACARAADVAHVDQRHGERAVAVLRVRVQQRHLGVVHQRAVAEPAKMSPTPTMPCCASSAARRAPMLAPPKTATPASSAASSSWCHTEGCASKTPSTSAMARGRSESARHTSPWRAGGSTRAGRQPPRLLRRQRGAEEDHQRGCVRAASQQLRDVHAAAPPRAPRGAAHGRLQRSGRHVGEARACEPREHALHGRLGECTARRELGQLAQLARAGAPRRRPRRARAPHRGPSRRCPRARRGCRSGGTARPPAARAASASSRPSAQA